MPARIRQSGVTTYGWPQAKRRAAALAALVDGTPCPFPFCRKPMTRQQKLDWDHTWQSLAHAHCNRSAGARDGNQRRRTRRLPTW